MTGLRAKEIVALPCVRDKMARGRYNHRKGNAVRREIKRFVRRWRLMDFLCAFATPEIAVRNLYPRRPDMSNDEKPILLLTAQEDGDGVMTSIAVTQGDNKLDTLPPELARRLLAGMLYRVTDEMQKKDDEFVWAE